MKMNKSREYIKNSKIIKDKIIVETISENNHLHEILNCIYPNLNVISELSNGDEAGYSVEEYKEALESLEQLVIEMREIITTKKKLNTKKPSRFQSIGRIKND